MAYNLPQFNLLCDIYTMPFAAIGSRILRIADQPCQLRAPTRGATGAVPTSPNTTIFLRWSIIFPALTDIREEGRLNVIDMQNLADLVNCPAGSNRWYRVIAVDDAAKGFSNEYRIAVVAKQRDTANPDWWSPPYE